MQDSSLEATPDFVNDDRHGLAVPVFCVLYL
jgi:hypothetical protein